MRLSVIREVMLYRYRYVAGLATFAIVLVGLLVVRPDLAPSGLSSADMDSAVRSATFNILQPLAQSTIELPFILMQKISMHFFGITEFAIKLPTLVLGILTGTAFMMMVRRWFRLNIALVTSLILVTSAAFLSLGRSGTGAIMATFWLSLFLLAATNIVHPDGKTRRWIIAATIMLPLSLYTPLMIYPIIAIGIAGIVHPHVRFTLKNVPHWQIASAGAFFVIAIMPLILGVIMHPQYALQLLGLPNHLPSWAELLRNTKQVISSLFNVGTTVVGAVPQPVFGAASLIVILLGLMQTIRDWYSARSHMLLIWSLLIIPIVIMSPDKLLICLIPAYLFMAIGIETLIREWYTYFPRNPYARIAGLVPLVVLIGGMMLSNGAQYFYGYFHGTPTARYTETLTHTRALLDKRDYKSIPTMLVVRPEELAFYNLLGRDYKRMTVQTAPVTTLARPTIVLDGAAIDPAMGTPKRIVTSYKTRGDFVTLRLFTP